MRCCLVLSGSNRPRSRCTVGVGHQVGVFLEAEVVLQDGGDQEGQLGVSGVGCVFEVVLAIAIWVIEEAAFG